MLHNMKNRVSCALLMTGITLAPAIGLAATLPRLSDGTLSATVMISIAFLKI